MHVFFTFLLKTFKWQSSLFATFNWMLPLMHEIIQQGVVISLKKYNITKSRHDLMGMKLVAVEEGKWMEVESICTVQITVALCQSTNNM